MSGDVRLESIKAYKRMIKYFQNQITILERQVYNKFCCKPKGRIYLPIANKPRIKK